EGWAGEGREPRQSQVTEAQFAVELEADGRVAAQVLDIADQGAVVLLPEVEPGILQLAWEQACAVQDVLGRETPLGESGKLELQSVVHDYRIPAPGPGGDCPGAKVARQPSITDYMLVIDGCQCAADGRPGNSAIFGSERLELRSPATAFGKHFRDTP